MFFTFNMRFHKTYSKNGVDDIRHNQRGKQRYQHRHRQIKHEFTKYALPEKQGKKRG